MSYEHEVDPEEQRNRGIEAARIMPELHNELGLMAIAGIMSLKSIENAYGAGAIVSHEVVVVVEGEAFTITISRHYGDPDASD